MKTYKQTVVVAVLAGMIGAAGALGGVWWFGALAEKPRPVAIVNLGGLIQASAGDKKVEQADVDKGFKQMQRIGEALAAKGYLVLDAQAVIDAPNEFYVPKRTPANKKGAGNE